MRGIRRWKSDPPRALCFRYDYVQAAWRGTDLADWDELQEALRSYCSTRCRQGGLIREKQCHSGTDIRGAINLYSTAMGFHDCFAQA